MTSNFLSVAVKGVFNLARARVIWRDGMLRIFTPDGLVGECLAQKPERKKGYLRAWDIKTDCGDIFMRGKCITCGGKKWRGVTYAPTDDLWRTADVQ